MSAYLTQAQLLGAIPANKLNDALDDDGDGHPDAGIIAQIIADASAAADGRLGARYPTPFTSELSSITVTAGGAGYTEPPLVVITGTATAPAAAVAIVREGVVVQVNVINGGQNYSAASISFTGGGGGAGATAIANLSIPAAVLRAAFVFALEEVYLRREMKDNPWSKEADSWRKRLEDVAARRMPLDATLAEDLQAAAGSNRFIRGRIDVRGDDSR